MARKPKEIAIEAYDQEVEKAMEAVAKSKQRYEDDCAKLKDALDKRDAARSRKLLDAIAKSSRTYDEILKFIIGDSEED